MKSKSLLVGAVFLSSSIVGAGTFSARKVTDKTFYIYTERGSKLNHYIPSGWMGDYGDLKFNGGWAEKPGKGSHAIQIKYTAERKQGAGWAGIFWQTPANNWGDKRGGYDLTGFKQVKFMARGEKGGEYIDKFMAGGITGQMEEGDSDQIESDAIELTKDWKEYTLDLTKRDLTHIIGGFCVVLNGEMNPQGATFYLDEIRYEK